jgi:hypothetical protein
MCTVSVEMNHYVHSWACKIRYLNLKFGNTFSSICGFIDEEGESWAFMMNNEE